MVLVAPLVPGHVLALSGLLASLQETTCTRVPDTDVVNRSPWICGGEGGQAGRIAVAHGANGGLTGDAVGAQAVQDCRGGGKPAVSRPNQASLWRGCGRRTAGR
ncbi:hypothetical protein GCM10009790_37820 [Georgenia ruanii]